MHVCHSAVFSHYITVCNVLGDVASGNGMIVTELQITSTSVGVHVREQGQTSLPNAHGNSCTACMRVASASITQTTLLGRLVAMFSSRKLNLKFVCAVLHVISFEPSKRFSLAPSASLSNFASV